MSIDSSDMGIAPPPYPQGLGALGGLQADTQSILGGFVGAPAGTGLRSWKKRKFFRINKVCEIDEGSVCDDPIDQLRMKVYDWIYN